MPDPLPQNSIGDDLHRTARAALSAIPFVGGAAVELFNRMLASPIGRRRDAWFDELADRLDKLEREERVSVEDLKDNDEFVSTVLQASQVSIRNHQQEKINALRNAVLNTALGQAPDDSKREMYLGFVDTFTVWHLRVLAFLANPNANIDASHLNLDLTTGHMPAVIGVLQKAFPELEKQDEFVRKVVADLDRDRLILGDVTVKTGHGVMGIRNVTQLGDEFLRFITEPKEADP